MIGISSIEMLFNQLALLKGGRLNVTKHFSHVPRRLELGMTSVTGYSPPGRSKEGLTRECWIVVGDEKSGCNRI